MILPRGKLKVVYFRIIFKATLNGGCKADIFHWLFGGFHFNLEIGLDLLLKEYIKNGEVFFNIEKMEYTSLIVNNKQDEGTIWEGIWKFILGN